jgi:hypothetical protein
MSVAHAAFTAFLDSHFEETTKVINALKGQ